MSLIRYIRTSSHDGCDKKEEKQCNLLLTNSGVTYMIDFKSVMSSFDILGIKPDIWSIPVLSLISNLKIRYRLEVGPH